MSLIGRSIGNYQIKAKLGEGGMGAVYLGEHPLIGKRVAVKVLLEELAAKEDIVARFFNEAKAVNDIGHANIVDIVDFGKLRNEGAQDIVYFIMEFLDGESLASRLHHTGLTFPETVHVIEQCCSALQASHDKGIIHRDLKPENIYLCPHGGDRNFVKLLDFGIAKLTGDSSSQSHKTRTGLVIGTPAYMSPEQCEGKGLVDSRSDVYSLGIVMYELLTGRVPFPGEGFGEVLVAHLTKLPDPPSTLNPNITPQLEAIVMHAIEKDRNRRFQTMDEFCAALRDPDGHLQRWAGGVASPLSAGSSGGTMMLGNEPAPPWGATGQRGPMTQNGPRPTTLSGAASETFNGELPRKSRTSLFVVVGGLAAAAGLVGYLGLGSGPAAQSAPVAPATAPVTPKLFTVTIKSEPSGARVIRADTNDSGTTPWQIQVKRGAPAFDVLFRLDGYENKTRTINTDRSYAVMVALKKLTAPAKPIAAVEPVEAQAEAKPKTEFLRLPPPADRDRMRRRRVRKPAANGTAHGGTTPSTAPAVPKDDGDSDDMKLLQPKF